MKIKIPQSVGNVVEMEDLRRYVALSLELISTEINGRLIFGDNIRGQLLTVEFPAANTSVSVQHALGRVPTGYIQTGANAAMSLYDGDAPNDSQNAYIKASSIGTARIFLF